MSSNGSEQQGGQEWGSGPVDIDSILWSSMLTSPEKTIWFTVLAVVLQAIIVSSVVTKTFQCFEFFHRTDGKLFMAIISLGCLTCVVMLGITCAQIYELVYHAHTEFHTIFRFLFISDQVVLIIGGFLNLTAGTYYTWRAWRMLNRKWWAVPPYALALTCAFIGCIICTSKGFQMPKIELQYLPLLPAFFERFIYLSRVWGGLSLGVDAGLFLSLTYLLIKSKDSVFHNESRLFHKLLALMYESMLPPVVVLAILETTCMDEGSPTTDWRKCLISCCPPLYFHSVLGALVSRQTIRRHLNSKLAADGVNLLSGGTASTARTFVGYPATASKRAEEGGAYELKSEAGSAVTVGGPMVKIEQNSATSEPDAYANGHPHLSPTSEVHTINRPNSNTLHSPTEGWDSAPAGVFGARGWQQPKA